MRPWPWAVLERDRVCAASNLLCCSCDLKVWYRSALRVALAKLISYLYIDVCRSEDEGKNKKNLARDLKKIKKAKKGRDESWILLAMATGCRWNLRRGIAKVVPHEASDQRPDSFPLKVMFSLALHLGVWLSSSLYAHAWTSFSLMRRKTIMLSFNQNRWTTM
ncbi:uncharacterized protein [Triticum aestivum]|uniref:uncharacterized protein n=1 Tax=Triticum aestivum TaxID=4565 RepID=UPI001D003DA1|nr:uncharacterized protein LOC123162732 [Triticum aestivum]